MPAKAPIYLKPTNSKKGKKCRLRDILSPDMISPPLGDFRHTVHIGRGGEKDVFGDMSFLQGKFELLPGKGDVQPQYSIQSEFLLANCMRNAPFAETPSPVLKNAISLPTIGGCQALTLPLISSTALPPEPLEDIARPPKVGSPEDVEILQGGTLLCSVDIFGREPSSTFADIPSKPDVLLDLLKNTDKAIAKANKLNGFNKSFFINAHSNSICYSNGGPNNSINYSNGGLNNSICYSNGGLNNSICYGDFQSKFCNGNRSFSGNCNENCNVNALFNVDIFLGYKQELSQHNKEWADRDSVGDRDSGMEELEFSKEISSLQDSQITGSLLSLELDLGPSILDEVLNIMDKNAARSRP